MVNEKIIIAGRACSGKTRLAERLAKELGVTLLKTCTTRPKRTPDENTYHFYTEDEAKAIPKSEKLFLTAAVDGYERWTGKADFLAAGIAVLDINGVSEAIQAWQVYGHPVRLIYVVADEGARREIWVKRTMKAGKSRQEAICSFESRENCESPMFDQAEARIQNAIFNVTFGTSDEEDLSAYDEDELDVWQNTFIPDDMDAFIRKLCESIDVR